MFPCLRRRGREAGHPRWSLHAQTSGPLGVCSAPGSPLGVLSTPGTRHPQCALWGGLGRVGCSQAEAVSLLSSPQRPSFVSPAVLLRGLCTLRSRVCTSKLKQSLKILSFFRILHGSHAKSWYFIFASYRSKILLSRTR